MCPSSVAGADWLCSDQSEPPAGNSARITGHLPPGVYFLIASTQPTFRDTPTARSPLAHVVFPVQPLDASGALLRLDVRFVLGPHAPDCRSKQCGSDGEDVDGCGVCPAGAHCVDELFVCRPLACQPDCASRDCGDDGCGGQCGQCHAHAGCSKDGRCIADSITCDGRQPRCSEHCGAEHYCASVDRETATTVGRVDCPRSLHPPMSAHHCARLAGGLRLPSLRAVSCRTARVARCRLRCPTWS